MKIDVYTPKICGYLHKLQENIELALAETGVRAHVDYHGIDFDEAQKLGIRGSPTIRINGKDPFEQKAISFA